MVCVAAVIVLLLLFEIITLTESNVTPSYFVYRCLAASVTKMKRTCKNVPLLIRFRHLLKKEKKLETFYRIEEHMCEIT